MTARRRTARSSRTSTPSDTAAAQGTSVSAWDITVRADATSTTDITGRLFTYALAAFTGGNGLPINQRVYVTTTDGFRYRTDTNGLDPNGFLMYGNQQRLPRRRRRDAARPRRAGHDQHRAGLLRRRWRDLRRPAVPAVVHPAVERDPQPRWPSRPPRSRRSCPTCPSAAASPATSPSSVPAARSATTPTCPAQYEFVISRDGTNFDPGNPVNRVLARHQAGRQQHGGLGRQGQRAATTSRWAPTTRYGRGCTTASTTSRWSTPRTPPRAARASPCSTRPAATARSATRPARRRSTTTAATTRSAPAAPTSAPLVRRCAASTRPPLTTATPRPATSPPRPSGPSARTTAATPTASCTGSFGDVKGLDTWVFYPSTTLLAPLNIISTAGAGAGGQPRPRAPPRSTPRSWSSRATTVLGNDTGTAITVTAHTSPPHGTVTIGADGSYTYTPDDRLHRPGLLHLHDHRQRRAAPRRRRCRSPSPRSPSPTRRPRPRACR